MKHVLVLLILITSVAAGAENSIPFDLHSNVIFIRASINDSEPLEMAFDSGTRMTTLDESVATRIGLDLSLKAKSSGASGLQEISIVKDQKLAFAGVVVREPMLAVYPLGFLSKKLNRRVDGIVGIELLRKYVVELDYPSRRMRVHPPQGDGYSGGGESFPVTYYRGLPVISGFATLFDRDPIPVRFQVDSGSATSSIMFWKAFVDKHQVASGVRDLRETEVTRFGGTVRQRQGRIQSMQIGSIQIAEPEVGLSDTQFGDPTVFDANLGNGFLMRFRVVFDLPHDRIVFERPPAQ